MNPCAFQKNVLCSILFILKSAKLLSFLSFLLVEECKLVKFVILCEIERGGILNYVQWYLNVNEMKKKKIIIKRDTRLSLNRINELVVYWGGVRRGSRLRRVSGKARMRAVQWRCSGGLALCSSGWAPLGSLGAVGAAEGPAGPRRASQPLASCHRGPTHIHRHTHTHRIDRYPTKYKGHDGWPWAQHAYTHTRTRHHASSATHTHTHIYTSAGTHVCRVSESEIGTRTRTARGLIASRPSDSSNGHWFSTGHTYTYTGTHRHGLCRSLREPPIHPPCPINNNHPERLNLLLGQTKKHRSCLQHFCQKNTKKKQSNPNSHFCKIKRMNFN